VIGSVYGETAGLTSAPAPMNLEAVARSPDFPPALAGGTLTDQPSRYSATRRNAASTLRRRTTPGPRVRRPLRVAQTPVREIDKLAGMPNFVLLGPMLAHHVNVIRRFARRDARTGPPARRTPRRASRPRHEDKPAARKAGSSVAAVLASTNGFVPRETRQIPYRP